MMPEKSILDKYTPEQKEAWRRAETNRGLQERNRQLEQLERVVDEMAAKLKALEWAGYDEDEAEVCPDCESPESLGKHVSGCGLQETLASYAAWKGMK